MLDSLRYSTIARPSGGFAMIAIDARESMRQIFRLSERPDADGDVTAFKRSVALELGALASAVLCDLDLGGQAIDVMKSEHPETGLIVAVDAFDEPRYGPLRESRLDLAAVDRAVAAGADALKLYLFWRPDAQSPARLDDARHFVDRCRELGVLSLIEGIVAGGAKTPNFDDALIRAAEAFGHVGPDLYKTHVPTLGVGDPAEIRRQSQRLTDVVGVPWVVLSNGVDQGRFFMAVQASCAGGASGVLAGRAVWRSALAYADPALELRTSGHARLQKISAIVDAHARPWFAA